MQDLLLQCNRLSSCTWDLSALTRDQTDIFCIARQIFNHWATRQVPKNDPKMEKQYCLDSFLNGDIK